MIVTFWEKWCHNGATRYVHVYIMTLHPLDISSAFGSQYCGLSYNKNTDLSYWQNSDTMVPQDSVHVDILTLIWIWYPLDNSRAFGNFYAQLQLFPYVWILSKGICRVYISTLHMCSSDFSFSCSPDYHYKANVQQLSIQLWICAPGTHSYCLAQGNTVS